MYSIRETLARQPYLKEVKTSVFKIPERVKAYDDTLFICRNVLKNVFELHSTANKMGGTFCYVIPYKELDIRVLKMVIKNDTSRRSKEWIKEYEEEQIKAEKEEQKQKTEMQEEASERVQFACKKVARELCL